jgi:hypothetical protein
MNYVLLFVFYCILLSDFDGQYIDYTNIHGLSAVRYTYDIGKILRKILRTTTNVTQITPSRFSKSLYHTTFQHVNVLLDSQSAHDLAR